ncbi:MAG TPA: hypothetical protein VLQ91_04980 [Draconibacterium sp.]|nr:hypothetical protein [Draconibacterium sp.]
MNINNKIQQTFNGPLTFMGITFMVIAVILVIGKMWILGILSFVISCFLLLTFSGMEIDTERRMIKPYYMLFGLVKNGKWQSLEKYVGLTLVPMRKVYSVFSRSNRKNDSETDDFRVYLINKAKKPALPLKSCKTRESAQDSMDEFSIWLKMPVYSVKRH